jgi:hypothetical protein
VTPEEIKIIRGLIAKNEPFPILKVIAEYCAEQSKNTHGTDSLKWQRWLKGILNTFNEISWQ